MRHFCQFSNKVKCKDRDWPFFPYFSSFFCMPKKILMTPPTLPNSSFEGRKKHSWKFVLRKTFTQDSHLHMVIHVYKLFFEYYATQQFCTKLQYFPNKTLNQTSKLVYVTNYEGVRIYQGIRMIKRSEMRPLGGATFWDNHLPAVTMILNPILVCLKPKILRIRWCHFL